MTIVELLAPDRVQPHADIASKKRALELLSTLIAESRTDLDQGEIFTSLLNREKLGSTGLGHQVAIPHGRVASPGPAVGAFVSLVQPIEFDAIDDQPVDLLFALIVPEESTSEHLAILAQLAELFRDEAYCQKLRDAESPEDLIRLLSDWHPANCPAA